MATPMIPREGTGTKTDSPFLCPKPTTSDDKPPAHLRFLTADLAPAERRALRQIAETADIFEAAGRYWFLIPVTRILYETLSTFEAEAADLEPDFDNEEDDHAEEDDEDVGCDEGEPDFGGRVAV